MGLFCFIALWAMKIIIHKPLIAEVVAEGIVIHTAQDALDLIYNPAIEGAEKIILHKENILPAFFDLSSGIAGVVLQKFVNYRIQLAIVGNFADASISLQDFMRESNKGGHIFFVENTEQAIEVLNCR